MEIVKGDLKVMIVDEIKMVSIVQCYRLLE